MPGKSGILIGDRYSLADRYRCSVEVCYHETFPEGVNHSFGKVT